MHEAAKSPKVTKQLRRKEEEERKKEMKEKRVERQRRGDKMKDKTKVG